MIKIGKSNEYAILENIDVKINNLALKIIQNSKICKCLKFNSMDALNQNITEDEIYSLINKSSDNVDNRRIYFQPFLDKSISDQRTELRIYCNFNMENRILSKCYFYVEIICNNNLWDLDDSKIRPLVILTELLQSLNGEDIGGVGLLNCQNQNFLIVPYNDYFSGYRVIFSTRSI